MFNIVQVTVGDKASTCLLVGGKPGNQFIGPSNPLGPEGSVYHLILPDFGYIKFTDVGPSKARLLWEKYLANSYCRT